VALRISLNLSVFIMVMSLRMSIVHFRPRTPRLVAMGQFAMGTTGVSKSGESSCLRFPGARAEISSSMPVISLVYLVI